MHSFQTFQHILDYISAKQNHSHLMFTICLIAFDNAVTIKLYISISSLCFMEHIP